MSNVYYDQIMALKGLSGFKDVIERWQRFSDNINRFHAKQELVVPDLLWVSDNGIDRTGLLKLLAGFLDSTGNLVDFYGNVKYFEYYLEYIPEKKISMKSKDCRKIRDAAGFRSEYRGILSIELDEWVGHFYEDNFINTMKYLSSMEDDIVFVFHIRNYNSESVEQLMQLLVLFFRIEVIEMKLPDSEELGAYIKNEISSFGLNLDQEAEDMIISTVNKLRKDQYFAGYDMLDRLAQDVVYAVYTSTPPYDGVVTRGMICDFAPDGMYVSELISNNMKVYTSQYGTN